MMTMMMMMMMMMMRRIENLVMHTHYTLGDRLDQPTDPAEISQVWKTTKSPRGELKFRMMIAISQRNSPPPFSMEGSSSRLVQAQDGGDRPLKGESIQNWIFSVLAASSESSSHLICPLLLSYAYHSSLIFENKTEERMLGPGRRGIIKALRPGASSIRCVSSSSPTKAPSQDLKVKKNPKVVSACTHTCISIAVVHRLRSISRRV